MQIFRSGTFPSFGLCGVPGHGGMMVVEVDDGGGMAAGWQDYHYLFLTDKLSPLVLATQPKLLSVNLTNNLISDVQSGAFANMTRLVRLILTKNKISSLEDGSLQGSVCARSFSPLTFYHPLNNPPFQDWSILWSSIYQTTS